MAILFYMLGCNLINLVWTPVQIQHPQMLTTEHPPPQPVDRRPRHAGCWGEMDLLYPDLPRVVLIRLPVDSEWLRGAPGGADALGGIVSAWIWMGLRPRLQPVCPGHLILDLQVLLGRDSPARFVGMYQGVV